MGRGQPADASPSLVLKQPVICTGAGSMRNYTAHPAPPLPAAHILVGALFQKMGLRRVVYCRP